jgi:hypothetical protein
MTDTTRQQWIETCADRYMTRGGLELSRANEFAEACAHSEEEVNGPNVEKWDSPANCADEDMSYWEDE